MSMSNEKLIEDSIRVNKKRIDLNKELQKLRINKEFISIIENELFNNFTKEAVYALGTDEKENINNIKKLEMVSSFKKFLTSIEAKSLMAEKILKDNEVALDSIRQGEF